MSEPEKRRTIAAWAQYGVAILISVGICWYYLTKVEWSKIMDSVEQANIPLALAGLVLPNLLWWLADTRVNQLVIQWFHKPIGFLGIFWVRGFTYLMAVVYPPLAEIGILIYLYRKTGMTAKLFGGIVFFKSVNQMTGLLFIITAATLVSYGVGIGLGDHVAAYWWWGGIAFGYFGLYHAWSYWIKGQSWGPLDKYLVRNSEFFIPYAQGTMKHWAIVWAYFILPMLVMFAGYYLVAAAFDVNVDPVLFILLSPLVFFLSALPVFFGGLGGTTLFWDMFFPGSGTEEAIVAMTLFLPAVRMVLRMVMGLVSLIPAQEDIKLIWTRRDMAIVPETKENDEDPQGLDDR